MILGKEWPCWSGVLLEGATHVEDDVCSRTEDVDGWFEELGKVVVWYFVGNGWCVSH